MENKSAQQIFRELYPATELHLRTEHPVKYQCYIEAMEAYAAQFSRPVTDEEIDAMFPYASSPEDYWKNIEAMREGAKALRDKLEGKG
jgi:hypothetical protein